MKLYDRFLRGFARSRAGGWIVANLFSRLDPLLLRLSKGRLSTGVGTTLGDSALLLTCVGARSGKERQVALLSTRSGEDYVIYASSFGRENHPGWYFNLRANPRCQVTASGRVQVPCVAREATGEERERLWAQGLELYEGYADYEQRTDRVIPVFALAPEPTAPGPVPMPLSR